MFCAGANIFMLRGSTHAWKVNFCKFTNETRLAIEDASAHSGIKFLAALNGICAGGGYELALACDEIFLVDDGNSAVSLPETPLLGVLPGNGRADAGRRQAQGAPRPRRRVRHRRRRREREARGRMAARRSGLSDEPVQGSVSRNGRRNWPRCPIARRAGRASCCIRSNPSTIADDADRVLARAARDRPRQAGGDADRERGRGRTSRPRRGRSSRPATQFWPLRAFRELDDALLRLRLNEPLIGTVIVKTRGDQAAMLAMDALLLANREPLAGARDDPTS